MKYLKKIKKAYKEAPKKSVRVYLTLRTIVLIIFIRQLMLHEWSNALLCLFSMFLFIIPFFIEKKFKIDIPDTLEVIILVFIFSSEILGELNNFYVRIPHFDTLMHTINGFICAGIGLSLVDLLNNNSESINLSPLFVSIVAFCFSMTVGVVWEFFEFTSDTFLVSDMQKDRIINTIKTVELDDTKTNETIVVSDINKTILYDKDGNLLAEFDGYLDIGLIDTMKDLMVNFIGALCFSIFGYLYILNRDKYRFVDNLILTRKMDVIKK